MNGLTTIGDKDMAAPLPRLYLRPDEAARVIGVSRRTLSAWQSARVIGFRRIGRTVLFSVADIQAAIDRYRIAPVGDLSLRALQPVRLVRGHRDLEQQDVHRRADRLHGAQVGTVFDEVRRERVPQLVW